MALSGLLLWLYFCLCCVAANWSGVDEVLNSGIFTHTYPGCVAIVGGSKGILYAKAFGSFTYGLPTPVTQTNPKVALDTIFDLASLTKVLVTTTSVMYLYQHNMISLDENVSSPSLLGMNFSNHGKDAITVRNLLLHNAGFPPDPDPLYWNKTFDCPETSNYHPKESFSCQELVYNSLMNQALINPVGSKYIYSDLSMITMMYVVGSVVRNNHLVEVSDLNSDCIHNQPDKAEQIVYYSQCFYEAFVRKYILSYLKLQVMTFLPKFSLWSTIVPAWNDTIYRHQVIQGFVSDGNSYALGGIAGHAGVFSNAMDILQLMFNLMFADAKSDWIDARTVTLFTKVYNTSQSSRAFGWDTNNYQVDTYRGCGNLSSETYYHTGYTGTQVCGDPERRLITILLTNRVYPNDSEESKEKIHKIRQQFNNAVLGAL